MTAEEYETAEHIIYNDLSTDGLYPVSKTVDRFNQDVAEKIVKKGEKWERLDSNAGSLIITSFGRLINTYTIKQLKPSITKNNVLIYVDGGSVRSSDLFKRFGWKHDMEEIKKKYREMGWRHNMVGK